MDDLKIAQALGAVEGPLRALVGEAEGQGRIAGAAAEAERIWQVGRVLAGEMDADYLPGKWTPYAAFLAELRKRAVPDVVSVSPGRVGDALVGVGYLRSDGQVQTAKSLAAAQSAAGLPMTEAERAAALPSDDPGFDGGPLPEPVKPFDNSGADHADVNTSKL